MAEKFDLRALMPHGLLPAATGSFGLTGSPCSGLTPGNVRASAHCPGLVRSSGTKRGDRQGMPPVAFGREILKFPVQRQALIHVTGTVEVRT